MYEYQNIDILILDHNNKFLFVLENKVFATDDKKQLEKYREYTKKDSQYEGYKKYGQNRP